MPAQDTVTRPRTAARRWGVTAAVTAVAATLLAGVPATASAQDHHRSDNRPQHSACHDRNGHHDRNGRDGDHRAVSIREAIGIAEHVIHGTVTSAELEKMKVHRKDKKARTVWEVEVVRHRVGYEVLIDPRTGCVLKAGKEEQDA